MENFGIVVILLVIAIIIGIIDIIITLKNKTGEDNLREIDEIRREIRESKNDTISHVDSSFSNYGKLISDYQRKTNTDQDRRMVELNQTVERQLNQVRNTVDEKLQKNLDERITQSFKLVNDRLEQVYKGLGEMQTLAQGVGDIKKVLANVKTRGILGEIQLKAILEEILTPSQYCENIPTKQHSNDRVEFAINMPGDGDSSVFLPIDSKFPGDAYSRIVDAYEAGDKSEIMAAAKNLERVFKSEAKAIKEKYIDPPFTTDFAIMFLPFEGLYSEAVRMGMVEILQRDYKVNIAGPTTMAALLNSLQMGFRTLAIQKRSGEVWKVLGAVKTEFTKFQLVLDKTRDRLRQADTELEKLVGARTNAINRKLRDVTELTEEDAKNLLTDDFDLSSDKEEN